MNFREHSSMRFTNSANTTRLRTDKCCVKICTKCVIIHKNESELCNPSCENNILKQIFVTNISLFFVTKRHFQQIALKYKPKGEITLKKTRTNYANISVT